MRPSVRGARLRGDLRRRLPLYADVGGTLDPLGDGGPGLPVVLLPAFALVVYGALRTLNLVRELGRSEGPSEDSAEN